MEWVCCTSRTFNTVAMVRSPQALASKATCNQAIYISVLFEVVDGSVRNVVSVICAS